MWWLTDTRRRETDGGERRLEWVVGQQCGTKPLEQQNLCCKLMADTLAANSWLKVNPCRKTWTRPSTEERKLVSLRKPFIATGVYRGKYARIYGVPWPTKPIIWRRNISFSIYLFPPAFSKNSYITTPPFQTPITELHRNIGRFQLKCVGTRWRTGGEVKGKLGNGVGSSTLHTTAEHGISSITTADAHTSAASSRLNWCPPPI